MRKLLNIVLVGLLVVTVLIVGCSGGGGSDSVATGLGTTGTFDTSVWDSGDYYGL